jgi:hypothetical protein
MAWCPISFDTAFYMNSVGSFGESERRAVYNRLGII